MKKTLSVSSAISELTPHIGKQENRFRIANLGERGLRWNIDKIEKEVVTLTSQDGKRRAKAHPFDVVNAPVKSRQSAGAVAAASRPKTEIEFI